MNMYCVIGELPCSRYRGHCPVGHHPDERTLEWWRRYRGDRSEGEARTVPAWLIWLVIALVLGAAETLTATLDLVLLAVAAGIAAAVAGLGLGPGFQFGAFALSAVL